MSALRPANIGGESSPRGLLGGRTSTARKIAYGIGGGAFVLGTILFDLGGAVGGIIIGVVAFLVTIETDNETIVHRRLIRAGWKARRKDGSLRFIPFDAAQWAGLISSHEQARGTARKQALARLQAMRDTPDGVTGFRWLESRRGEPGIGWHRPPHAEEYLSVAFTVRGQVEGIESDRFLASRQEAFGNILNATGKPTSLLRRIQTLTRVLPVDSARHERWLVDNLDPIAKTEGGPLAKLVQSYSQLVQNLRTGHLFQRHYMVGVWPVSDLFRQAAEDRGDGTAGLRAVLTDEIRAFTHSLASAGFRGARPLTATQTAAVCRHLQNPDYPIDRVADLTPDTGWLPSEDSWSYTTYVGAPYGPGGPVTAWKSMTARISGANVEPANRDNLWMHPLLSGMSTQIVRTLSFHLELVPQAEARAGAREDLTSDRSEQLSDDKKGKLRDETTDLRATGASRRRDDLRPGKPHQGANWIGYLTISARDEKGLRTAIRTVTAAADEAGIQKLDWLAAQSSTVNCYTWPLGRGITPRSVGLGDRALHLVTGKKAKEAL